jgi:hypothetical protein
VDETYLHPNPNRRKALNKDRRLGWRSDNTQIIFGMVERDGKAKVRHVKSSGARVLLPEIEKNIAQGSTVFSDEWTAYHTLPRRGYQHETTNHRKEQYVIGNRHTQNVENLWSNMKRGIKGVYRHVDAKYVQAYANEYAFRYSHRKDFRPMFWALLGRVAKYQATK